MASTALEFFNLVEKSFRFEYLAGESTLVGYPHTTGWRALPTLTLAQIDYAATAEFKDGSTVKIQPSQTVCIKPGVTHLFTKITRRPCHSRWSHIQCEIFPGLSLFYLVEPPLILRGSQSRKIGRLNQELGEISRDKFSIASLLKRQALGWDLISTLFHSVDLEADRLDLIRHASRLTPVLAYIEDNLAKPISHDLLARAAALSPSRFHFLFRAALGSPPYEYVQQVRLKKAQELLIRTDRSVAEIGRDVGHPDPYHFSRTFRRKVGLSPAQYRKRVTFRSF